MPGALGSQAMSARVSDTLSTRSPCGAAGGRCPVRTVIALLGALTAPVLSTVRTVKT